MFGSGPSNFMHGRGDNRDLDELRLDRGLRFLCTGVVTIEIWMDCVWTGVFNFYAQAW